MAKRAPVTSGGAAAMKTTKPARRAAGVAAAAAAAVEASAAGDAAHLEAAIQHDAIVAHEVELAEEAAERAGLRYVSDSAPGITRRRAGRGFSYRMPDGSPVSERRRRAITTLAIPPAWTDVWICTDGRGHLQATGRDDRGRKQYRYHADWRVVRDENKFERLLEFGLALPDLRSSVDEDLRRPGLPHEKVVALAIALLDRTLIRVGNDQYRQANGTYGLTTMEDDHVQIRGADLSFCFIGKGGQEHQVDLHEPLLAKAVRRCHELGGRELFTYKGEDGAPVRIDSADCNEYVAARVGEGATVKYFRTWGATVTVMEELAALGPDRPASDSIVLAAIDVAADRLGNTRAVCRRAYVHPGVIEAHTTGTIGEAWASSRSTATMSRGERATLKLLEQLRADAA